MSEDEEEVILVVGSLGLDRLLTVPTYPQADTKVRTTAYHEYGGGNSGNTASAMAKLSRFFYKINSKKFRIKLLSKVGDDAVGKQLKEELESVGVDCSLPLFILQPNTTTSFVTVLVSETEHTRTCLHTPGTCGELTVQDVDDAANSNTLDEIFHNVIHLHSDSRHTEAALALAMEARKRGIPVSVDVEKDRHSKAQNQLLEYATILFTNSQQMGDYLNDLSLELEQTTGRKLISSAPVLSKESSSKAATASLSKTTQEVLLHATRPSFHFARWHGQTNKEIVVTKGKLGSLRVQCISFGRSGDSEKDHSLVSMSSCNNSSNEFFQVHQDVLEQQLNIKAGTTEEVTSSARYEIHASGVLASPDIVDTTGAGDAFIGAYILAKYNLIDHPNINKQEHDHSTSNIDHDDNTVDPIQFALDFSSWVAGKKLGGPGGRIGVPTSDDAEKELGTDLMSIQKSLKAALLPFGSS